MAGNGFSHQPIKVEKIATKYRTIKTNIPVPESISMLEKMYEIEAQAMHGQLPMVWDRADDFQIYDQWGNIWLDFTSTIFVANAGHGNKRIVKALKEVLDKPLLHTYTYASSERIDYLEYLIKNTPKQFEKAFLLSAGTEATEAALKLMRLNGQKQGKKQPGIICFEGNWHGRTMGAQMMAHNPVQKEWIGHIDPNIHFLPFPYPWQEDAVANPAQFFWKSFEKLLSEKNLSKSTDFCGIMMETFQGWGSVFYPEQFVQEVANFASENGILLAFDEMQAGFGRTGELFGYMHYNVEPDLICCGKGASSSLPLAFVLGSKDIMDLPEIGSMSSTHSANPAVCVAGKANLEAILEGGLIENSKKLGHVFHNKLQALMTKFPNHISQVLGKGLLAALHFNSPQGEALTSLCDKICELCMQRGVLLVHTGRESIKLAPPLTITKAALIEGINVIETAVSDIINMSEV